MLFTLRLCSSITGLVGAGLDVQKAMREAQRAGLDLIGVALTTQPPVFRLGNADKAAHAARQREKELRRKEVETRRKHTVKEVCACSLCPCVSL